MRIKTSVDTHQNGRRCAGERKTIALVSRPDAEPRLLPSAYAPVLVGISVFFAGYLSDSFSGCLDRMDRINRKPCALGFRTRIARVFTDLVSVVFNAKVKYSLQHPNHP